MLSLDRVLDGLVVDVDPFALCEVRGEGRLDVGCQDRATLHYVIAGQGVFRVAAWPDIAAPAGTVVIIPPAVPHRLRAGGEGGALLPHCRPLAPDWAHRSAGEGECGVLVTCGRIRASYREVEGVFNYLHEPIVTDLARNQGLGPALKQVLDEFAQPRPGSRALIRALMQQLLILLLREHCQSGECHIPWMAAAQDERLWAATGHIFKQPAAPHSLESLAERAGMSRSSFAEHFKQSFGRGPMDLVRELRLVQAAQLLATSDTPVKAVAEQVGYDSRSYFSRAFRDAFGLSPADYRLQQQSDEGA